MKYDELKGKRIGQAIQHGLSCTKDPILMERYLNDQINVTKVRKNFRLLGITFAAQSAYGSTITWNFVKRNWTLLAKM